MGFESAKKILIVDDEPENLQLIVESIEKMEQQYNILLANNAIKAITIIKDEVPDLIITDWEMPGLDGIDLIKMVKEDPSISHIPILMCTGVMVTAEHLKAALEAGAEDYIRKPFDRIELNARLNTMMKLSDSVKKTLELNEKKERLISLIAHDLRTPLAAIKYLANNTLAVNNNPSSNSNQIVDAISQIEEQATATYNLLNNLLLWIKLPDSNKLFHPAPHQIRPLIEECVSFTKTSLVEKKLNFQIEATNTNTAYFDRELIAAAIRNLLSNAVKFSRPNGTIRISTSIENNLLKVEIADNGCGMTIEQVKRVRLINKQTEIIKSKKNTNGWGVGLQLVSQILRLHHSQIEVESYYQKGSRFWFYLKLVS